MLHCLLSFSTGRKREELPFSLKCNRAFLLLFPGHGSRPLDLRDESSKGRAVGDAPAAGGRFCLAASVALASETRRDG